MLLISQGSILIISPALKDSLPDEVLENLGEAIEDEFDHVDIVNKDTAFVVRRVTFSGPEGGPILPFQYVHQQIC